MLPGWRLLTRKKKSRNSEKGQASVMIGMMMMTFILLFTFVVNTGMLVHAKINLQNAADLAAYAGAAVQARQLNHISYLNYEMRRQYKKFLYRYYVLGSMAQNSHPTDKTFHGKRIWSPNAKPDGSKDPAKFPVPRLADVKDFKVPAVCTMITSQANPCQLNNQMSLAQTPAAGGVINSTLQKVVIDIDKVQQAGCISVGRTNMLLLYTWLYNTDPDLKNIVKALKAQNQTAVSGQTPNDMVERLNIILANAKGLGLIPREKILSYRIGTLETYVNAAPMKGMTIEKIRPLVSSNQADAASRERSILAFYSAFNTLGNHVFSDEDANISMDELLPTGPNPLILLKQNRLTFDAYAELLAPTNSCQNVQNLAPSVQDDLQSCTPCVTPLPVVEFPVGVSKDPTKLTYYAVKLEASARLLFNPFGDTLRLRAYSAARPFGSRIGPNLTSDDFTIPNRSNPDFCGNAGAPGGKQCLEKIPNLPVTAGDVANVGGKGWEEQHVIGSMFEQLADKQQNLSTLQGIDGDALDRALAAAMAPNPWEIGKYNIPISDVSDYQPERRPASLGSNAKNLTDFWVQNFDKNGDYAFWAPIAPDNADQNQFRDKLIAEFKDFLKNNPNKVLLESLIPQSFIDAIATGLSSYVDRIRTPGSDAGEDGESFHIVRLKDPFNSKNKKTDTNRTPINLPPDLIIDADNPMNVKTSWGEVKDKDQRALARAGYSVKFVPFKALLSPQPSSNDPSQGGTYDNLGGLNDGSSDEDMNGIQH